MNSLDGHLLIASPELLIPIFARTVILMLEQGGDGATGVVLNRPTDTTVTALAGRVFEAGFAWDKPIHLGGPIAGPLTALHTVGAMADREVLPGVYQTRDATKVQHLIGDKPEPSLILANRTGWCPGQLEEELDGGSWLTLPARAEHVLWVGRKDLWRSALGEFHARRLSAILGLRGVPPDPGVN